MTETPSAPPAPQFRMRRVHFADLFATMQGFATPANAALDAAILAEIKAGKKPEDAIRDVSHLEAIARWCHENVEDAARIVLCAVYLANGHFPVQEQAETEAAAAEPPAAAAEPTGS